MINDTALLVIDVQKGMFAEDHPVYQAEELLATIGDLLAKARTAEVPVIYIQQAPKAGQTTYLWHPSCKASKLVSNREKDDDDDRYCSHRRLHPDLCCPV
jgi:nicotinamidase-related amidase